MGIISCRFVTGKRRLYITFFFKFLSVIYIYYVSKWRIRCLGCFNGKLGNSRKRYLRRTLPIDLFLLLLLLTLATAVIIFLSFFFPESHHCEVPFLTVSIVDPVFQKHTSKHVVREPVFAMAPAYTLAWYPCSSSVQRGSKHAPIHS